MSTSFEGAGPDRSHPAACADRTAMTSNVIPLRANASAMLSVSTKADVPEQPEGLPAGYFVRDRHLCTMRVTKEGDEEVVELCPAFVVAARYRQKGGSGWGRVIRFTDPDGQEHHLQVLERDLAKRPQDVLAIMADAGFDLPSGKASRDAILFIIRGWRPTHMQSSVLKFGWTDDSVQSYVQRPDKVIGGDDVIAGFEADPALVASVQEAGTIEDWRSRVAALCIGNPLLAFSVSVAFAGPLLALLGLPGCGFHLYGAPGKGKSTLLSAAASVMGDRSFRGSWNITKNALEGYGTARNDNVLILDEIGESQAATLTETIYMLGNGQGKGRAGSRGEATPRVSFRLAILSSGELAAFSHGAAGGKRPPDGTAIRLIDLRADGQRHGAFDELHGAASPAAFARLIDRATQEVYGTAGRHFIELLIRNRAKEESFRQRHRGIMAAMRKTLASVPDGQVERAIERFAAVALAGEIASKIGLTGWKPGEAEAAATLLLQNWFTDRMDEDGLSATEVLATTQDWLRANTNTVLTQANYANGTIAGPFKAAKDKTWIYLSADLWASIHGAEDATAAARALVKLGVMVHGDGKNLQHKAPRWIPGRPRVFKLRLASFEEVVQTKPE